MYLFYYFKTQNYFSSGKNENRSSGLQTFILFRMIEEFREKFAINSTLPNPESWHRFLNLDKDCPIIIVKCGRAAENLSDDRY